MLVKIDPKTKEALGSGRRKTSVARVRMRPGTGKIVVNGRPFDEYFLCEQDRRWALEVLEAVGKKDTVDITIRVSGGGMSGQAGACRMGIARALVSLDQSLYEPLRDGKFLTRDARMKERKKYGLHGARRGTQFSKR